MCLFDVFPIFSDLSNLHMLNISCAYRKNCVISIKVHTVEFPGNCILYENSPDEKNVQRTTTAKYLFVTKLTNITTHANIYNHMS